MTKQGESNNQAPRDRPAISDAELDRIADEVLNSDLIDGDYVRLPRSAIRDLARLIIGLWSTQEIAQTH